MRLRREQQVLDEREEPLGVAVDHLQPRLLFDAQPGRLGVVVQQLEVAADRRERRTQLMRDERDELVLHPVELAQPLVLHLGLCQQRLAVALRLDGCGDVEREALAVPRVACLVARDRVAVAQPDIASVLRQEPVLDLERLAALARRPLQLANPFTILRVQVVDEERLLALPFLGRVAEDALDLGADVCRRLVDRVRRVHVRDQRQLLDQRAVTRLRLLARGDVQAAQAHLLERVHQQARAHRREQHRGKSLRRVRHRDARGHDHEVQDGVRTWAQQAADHPVSIGAGADGP